jgi:hypothetical protein
LLPEINGLAGTTNSEREISTLMSIMLVFSFFHGSNPNKRILVEKHVKIQEKPTGLLNIYRKMKPQNRTDTGFTTLVFDIMKAVGGSITRNQDE